MPQGEAATGRATLGDIITPSTSVTVPLGPASAPPPSGQAVPVTVP